LPYDVFTVVVVGLYALHHIDSYIEKEIDIAINIYLNLDKERNYFNISLGEKQVHCRLGQQFIVDYEVVCISTG
jgi:hypothetical protein